MTLIIMSLRVLAKTRLCHTLVSVNKPIHYSSVRDYFKSSFKNIVPDITAFSTYSLRAGGASAAANAGVEDRLFFLSATNGYVDDSLVSRLSVSQSLSI